MLCLLILHPSGVVLSLGLQIAGTLWAWLPKLVIPLVVLACMLLSRWLVSVGHDMRRACWYKLLRLHGSVGVASVGVLWVSRFMELSVW